MRQLSYINSICQSLDAAGSASAFQTPLFTLSALLLPISHAVCCKS